MRNLHRRFILCGNGPSSIYSCSLSHILEHVFFCLGRLGSQGSKEKKVDLSFSEQKNNLNFFLNILATALKCYIK